MRILLIGDVIGRPGRDVVGAELQNLRETLSLDFVILNAENAAGGFGLTRKIANEFFALGIDVLTTGNHWLDQREILTFIDEEDRVLRPINYPKGTPGRGANIFQAKNGSRVLVINPMGRVFMETLDDPFAAVESELCACPLGEGADAIVVDMHAEATSEKQALGWYLDGRVSGVFGTHTHVGTVDAKILPQSTAYLTDVGMTGPTNSVIGSDKDAVLERFLTSMPNRLSVADGPCTLNSVLVDVDEKTGQASLIERIDRTVN